MLVFNPLVKDLRDAGNAHFIRNKPLEWYCSFLQVPVAEFVPFNFWLFILRPDCVSLGRSSWGSVTWSQLFNFFFFNVFLDDPILHFVDNLELDTHVPRTYFNICVSLMER